MIMEAFQTKIEETWDWVQSGNDHDPAAAPPTHWALELNYVPLQGMCIKCLGMATLTLFYMVKCLKE